MNFLLFPLKLIFYYPGRVLLWFGYIFPQKGKITESRRQFKEGGLVMAFFASCGFWAFLAFVLVMIGGGINRNQVDTPTEEIQNGREFQGRVINRTESEQAVDGNPH